MKIWKNESKNKPGVFYFSTSFYDKTMDGEEMRYRTFVDFQRGLEPSDTLDGDFIFRTSSGEEYTVLLKAAKNMNDEIEPRFLFFKGNNNGSAKSYQSPMSSQSGAIDDVDDDDLPF